VLSHNERPGPISNLMKNMLTHISRFQRQTPGEIVGKICPFREIPVMRKERGRGGVGI